ncbi:pickpocket protein 28-like [Episyrphus balteatus]|uniref:pickpocket protein 28-like n=1 Tax=Episyrphus balteatus TaxID=286459 RepID=UPI0024866428|nr:pickpocket protein 28-like [Episyrphus balteatus]
MSNLRDKGSNSKNIAAKREIITNGFKFQAFKETIIEYFQESTINGLKYIIKENQPALDRIIWLLAVIISISMCLILIGNLMEERTNNPIIVAFNEKVTSVSEIPFPSVTICPETKTRTDIFNYTNAYKKISNFEKLTEDEEYFWNAVSQICEPSFFKLNGESYLANASDLIKAMSKVAPIIFDNFEDCKWRNKFYYCRILWNDVVTDEGICFSFNSLKSEYYRTELYKARKIDLMGFDLDNVVDVDWNLENGYKKDSKSWVFPNRVMGAGDRESLIVSFLDKKVDQQPLCRNSVGGFKVILHTPGEDPQVSKNFIQLPLDQSVTLTIRPNIMTSRDLRHYSLERRQCYYQNERYLRYFKVYTQANCELE